MRRNTWCGKSAQRSYQHKGWCRHSPRGRRLPSVSLSPNANENGALLSKRLWGSAPPIMQVCARGKTKCIGLQPALRAVGADEVHATPHACGVDDIAGGMLPQGKSFLSLGSL